MYFLIFIIIPVVILGVRIYYNIKFQMCICDTKMEGKVVIVTGANTGIGYEAAKDLANRGARVILACRNVEKGTKATNDIIKATGNSKVLFKQLDLSSLRSVRNFAADVLNNEPKIDVLINNAGTGQLDNSLTEDNLPIEVQVNHFAPFLLTILLLPLLKKSAPSRIINVASVMHYYGKVDVNTFHKQVKNNFTFIRLYSDTKLANILFTNKLSEDLKGTGVTVNSLHPGGVSTDIFRNVNIVARFLIKLAFLTPWQGAQTIIHLAVSPELKEATGKYFVDCCEKKISKRAQDKELASKLWDLSIKVTGEKKNL